jgi:hypothetical protein
VAINPYKRFPIYTQRVIKMYIGKRRNEVPPHIFCISDGAYMDMLTSKLFLSKRAKILNKNPSTHPPVKGKKKESLGSMQLPPIGSQSLVVRPNLVR